MTIEKATGLPSAVMYPLRVAATLAVLLVFSRQLLAARPTSPLASAAAGAVVFALWIAPDLVFGPGYRHSWLFQNALTGGAAVSSLPIVLHTSAWFLAVRAGSCAFLVPPVEELFWRGWAMRWIAASDFQKIPLWRLPGIGLLAGGAVVCRRTRTLLGSRAGCRNRVQLVDGAHAQSDRLHRRPCRYQRVVIGVRSDDAPV